MSQLKVCTRIASKKQNLDQNCVLQESCKTVRRLQRSILLVRRDHCVGDWIILWNVLSLVHDTPVPYFMWPPSRLESE